MKIKLSCTLALFACLGPVRLFAGEPGWVQNPKHEDAEYRYYVGRSNNAVTESQGFRDALGDARYTAATENFPSVTRIRSKAVSTSLTSKMHREVESKFPEINWEGFEQVDQHVVQGSQNNWNVTVYYRYSKSAITIEKQRLIARASLNKLGFSEADHLGDVSEAAVLIESNPPGVDVYIDDELYGKTPLRSSNVLEPGEHVLKLDHSAYVRWQSTFKVEQGVPVQIIHVMQQGKSILNVDAYPEGAAVSVNGKFMGNSPLKNIEVDAGDFNQVVVEDHYYETAQQEVSVPKDQNRTISIKLVPKYATFSVNSELDGASVEVIDSQGSREIDLPVRNKSVDSGTREFTFKRTGYKTMTKKERLEPGKHIVLKDVVFEKEDPIETKVESSGSKNLELGKVAEYIFADADLDRRYHLSFRYLTSSSSALKNYSSNFYQGLFDFRITSLLGVGCSAGYTTYSPANSNLQTGAGSTFGMFGTLYLLRSKGHYVEVFVRPELGVDVLNEPTFQPERGPTSGKPLTVPSSLTYGALGVGAKVRLFKLGVGTNSPVLFVTPTATFKNYLQKDSTANSSSSAFGMEVGVGF